MGEKRQTPRIDTNMELLPGTSTDSRIIDMSTTGVFIEDNDPLPINAELDLNLQLPDNPEIISANARVVWIKSPDSNASAGMGMQFTNILPEQQKKLNDFMVKIGI